MHEVQFEVSSYCTLSIHSTLFSFCDIDMFNLRVTLYYGMKQDDDVVVCNVQDMNMIM